MDALQKLDFLHSVHFGADAHRCDDWLSPDRLLHSDAPIAVVVTRKTKVAGLVGFEILGRTMLVRQLQGAPKANFHDGTRVEAYLLSCAEKLCVALRMTAIRVVDADTAIAYRDNARPEDRPSEIAKVHMRKIYSYPAEVGYAKTYCHRLRRRTHYRHVTAFRSVVANVRG